MIGLSLLLVVVDSAVLPPPFIYGGADAYVYGDSWTINLNTTACSATSVNSTSPPGIRQGLGMVVDGYDAYLWGGYTGDDTYAQGMWKMDRQTNTWSLLSTTGPEPPGRLAVALVTWNHAAYIFGGAVIPSVYEPFSLNFSIFNFSTNVWSNLAAPGGPPPRFWFGYTVCKQRIYVVGGRDANYLYKTVWMFDLVNSSWTMLANFPTFRVSSTLVCVGDEVWNLGGENGNTKGISDFYTLSTLTNTWTSRGGNGVNTFNHVAISYNAAVYVFGGRQGPQAKYSSNVWICVAYSCSTLSQISGFGSGMLTAREQTSWIYHYFCNDTSTGCIPCTVCLPDAIVTSPCSFLTDTVCTNCTMQVGCATTNNVCSVTAGYTTQLSCTSPLPGYTLTGDIAQPVGTTNSPTTKAPTRTPTSAPTQQPTVAPTTLAPTPLPTLAPTSSPTFASNRPQCWINQNAAQRDPANTLPLIYDVVFNQAVTGLTTSDFTLVSRAVGTYGLNLIATNASVYQLQVTSLNTDSPPVVVNLPSNMAYSALTSQPNDPSTSTDNSIVVDRSPPSVTSVTSASSNYNATPLFFTITFSEPVQNFSLAGLSLNQSCCVGTNYSLTLNMTGCTPPCTSIGVILKFYLTGQGALSLNFGAGFAMDIAGNTLTPFQSAPVIWDNVAPSCVVAQAPSQADPTSQTPIFFLITFSEQVFGMNGVDVTLLSSPVYLPLNLVSNSSTGSAFLISVYNTINAQQLVMSYSANLVADATGNKNLDCTFGDNVVQFDQTQFPVSAIVRAPGQTSPINTSPLKWVVCFGRAINASSFTSSDVTLTPSSGLVPTILQINSTCWRLNVTGMGASDLSVSVSFALGVVQDAAGNANQASTGGDVIVWDVTSPKANIQPRVSGTTRVTPVSFQIDLTEAIAFNATWVNVQPTLTFGSLGSLNRSLTNLTTTSFILNLNNFGETEGVVLAQIVAGTFSDAAGNLNVLGTQPNSTISFDFVTRPPTLYAPAQNGTVSSLVRLNIAEVPRVNSVYLKFTRASDGVVSNTTLGIFAAGNYSIVFDLADLSSSFSGSGGGLTPGNIYQVALGYTDTIGNPPAEHTVTNVLYPIIFNVTCSGGCSGLLVDGGTQLTINGMFAITSMVGLGATVTYGSLPCTGVSVSSSQINCTATAGVGANLQIAVNLIHYANYQVLGPSVSYIPPSITNSSLRIDSPSNNTVLTHNVTAGQVVFFNGSNWGTDVANVVVTYGPQDFVCTIQNFSATQIGCITAVGTGSDLRFTVTVGGQSSPDQATDFSVGYDTTAVVPVVTDVSGCVKSGSGTINCPTSGESSPGVPVLLTLKGVNFQPPALVFVCSSNAILISSNNTVLVVQLPTGVGIGCDVRVQPLSSISSFVPRALVSYAPPSITSITGCTNSPNGPISCNPLGGDTIVITGSNFGSSGALVLLGSQTLQCSPVVHTGHGQLSCQLPASRGTNLLVSVTQANSQNSGSNSNLTVSYRKCNPGQYVSGSTCSQCNAGTYSSVSDATTCANCSLSQYNSFVGATSCALCPAGSYCGVTGLTNPPFCGEGTIAATQGLSVCTQCAAGTYASSMGLTVCTSCSSGSYQTSSAQSTCTLCEVGTYSSSQGATSCSFCPPGYVTNTNGSTSCAVCLAGTYANMSVVCANCTPGTFQGSSAGTSCIACDAGKFAEHPGSGECNLCSPGLFQIQSRQSFCSECAPGRYGPVGGLTSCFPCRTGTVSADPASTDCLACEPGKAQGQTEQVSCDNCSFGTYAPVEGLSTCQMCASGMFASSLGSIECTQCNAGTYSLGGQANCTVCEPGSSSGVGQASCQLCPGGKASLSGPCVNCQVGNYSDLAGSTACQQCPAGTFGALSGLSACSFCEPGTYGNQLGRSVCSDCELGRASILRGSTTCPLCEAGWYGPRVRGSQCLPCQAGQFSNISGLSTCIDCPAGQFSNVEGLSVCSDCSVGFYSGGNAKTCTLCPLGKYAIQSAQSACLNCAAGTFSLQEGAISCPACPIGRSATAGAQCSQCGPGFANPWTAQEFCFICDLHSRPNPEFTDCLCNPGYYQLNRTECDLLHSGFSVGNVSLTPACSNPFVCEVCVQGADCAQRGTTEESLLALKGWWKDPESATFWRCPFTHCVGSTQICAAHRRGPLCSLCEPGYVAATMASNCDLCPSKQSASSYTGGILALVVIILLLVCLAVLRLSREAIEMAEKDRQLRSNPQAQQRNSAVLGSTAQVKLPSHKDKIPDLWRTASTVTVLDFATDETDNSTKVFTKVSRKPDVMFKLKVLISFVQISYSLSALGVVWPSAFIQFLDAFRFVNFDFIPWQSVGCLTQIDYLAKATIVALLPPSVAILLGFLFFLPLWLLKALTVDMSDAQTKADHVQAQRQRLLIQATRLGFFLVFLIYPYLCSTVVNIYNCTRILDEVYMTFDFSVRCTSDRWTWFASVHVASLIIYPIGIPFLYWARMYTYRRARRLNEPLVRATMGFLYDAYTASNWYFEVVDMGFKLFMTSILALFPSIYALQIAMCVIVLYLMIHLLVVPYVRKGDDRVHVLCLSELFMIALAGLVINQDGLDSSSDTLLSVLLIFLSVIFFIALLIISFRNALKLFRNSKIFEKLKLRGDPTGPTLGTGMKELRDSRDSARDSENQPHQEETVEETSSTEEGKGPQNFPLDT